MVRFNKLNVAKAVLPDNCSMVEFQAKQARLSLLPELQIIASKLRHTLTWWQKKAPTQDKDQLQLFICFFAP
jgi:hypothetical protein